MSKQELEKMNRTSGFTIIEVVLVLAIAGLIFLMVFIALPALQRGQHDTQRKSDLAKIATQITAYQSSARGAIPSSATELGNFVREFLKGSSNTVAGSEYTDPSGAQYTIRYQVDPSDVAQVGYFPHSSCDVNSSNGVSSSTVARDYALTTSLEGQSIPYCLDNKG